MSYLVEQPPYCDLLRLSLSTRRFVRFGRTPLRFVSLDGLLGKPLSAPLACLLEEGVLGELFSLPCLKILHKFSEGVLPHPACEVGAWPGRVEVRFLPRAKIVKRVWIRAGAKWDHVLGSQRPRPASFIMVGR